MMSVSLYYNNMSILRVPTVMSLGYLYYFATVQDRPDPTNHKYAGQWLKNAQDDSMDHVLTETPIDDCSEAWDEDVQEEADVSETHIGLAYYVIRTTHRIMIYF